MRFLSILSLIATQLVEAAMAADIALPYVPFVLIYLALAISLFGYTSAIVRSVRSARSEDGEDPLSQQRMFRKLNGIMMLVILVLTVPLSGGLSWASWWDSARSDFLRLPRTSGSMS